MNVDVTTHHIEGYARAALEAGKPGHFDVPLISHIEGNLHVGGCIDGVQLPTDFRYVISLYKWEKYQLGPDTERFEVEMYDAGELPDLKQLHQLAELVSACIAEAKTLVHCQAGLNRSNLVTALALIKDGRTPEAAISFLRERRSPVVLCNQAFENWLLTQ